MGGVLRIEGDAMSAVAGELRAERGRLSGAGELPAPDAGRSTADLTGAISSISQALTELSEGLDQLASDIDQALSDYAAWDVASAESASRSAPTGSAPAGGTQAVSW